MSEYATLRRETRETGEEQEKAEVSHNYLYAEFAGWAGERYLKKILRQILPMALYRTWEIFVEHQARGNDCYLGISKLADLAGRTGRTMQKNLAALGAKQLLIERAERKLFCGPQNTVTSRVVVVKDFSKLYALAHDYHEWLNAVDYIAPDRIMIELLTEQAQVLANVRRFENYRRVLYTQQPGPAPRVREEDRWFTEYQTEAGDPCEEEGQVKEANQQKTSGEANKHLSKERAKDLSKDSPKRINVLPLNEKVKKDGYRCDSVRCSLERSEKKAKALMASSSQQQGQKEITSGKSEYIVDLNGAGSHALSLTSAAPDYSHARRAAREIKCTTHQDLLATPESQHDPSDHTPLSASEQPLAHLVRSFLQTISVPFGDLNPKGSQTRVFSLIAANHLDNTAVLLCLIRASIIARDTSTIRPEHWNHQTGRANRMPLFCTLFQRFAQAYMHNGRWEYTWQQMEKDIATDEHLTRWQSEQHALVRTLTARQINTPEIVRCTPNVVPPTGEQPEQAQNSAKTVPPHQYHSQLSQTPEAREERTAFAHTVLRRMVKMAVTIHEPIVLWEHVACGCPLYHTRSGKEVCALCFPDPTWSEEVRALIHAIVEARPRVVVSEGTREEQLPHTKSAPRLMQAASPWTKWTKRADALTCGTSLVKALASRGYTVEMEIREVEERYQVILRSQAYELVLETPQQVQCILEDIARGSLDAPVSSAGQRGR